jgi:phosphonate transport system ATP-binding protein
MKLEVKAASGRHPSARAGDQAAIRNATLTVQSGEQLAVIGPSGAGKTTLLHLLACALRPASGEVLLDGVNPWPLSAARLQALRGRLFLAPQVPPLPPRQRVVTSVLAGRLPQESLWASLRSLFYPADIALADRSLQRFDLSDKLFDRVDRLSGGERQRVGLARALASNAKLLLIDEPLSALDPTRAQQAITSLTQGAHERGATLVATLHHVEMALANFPRIIGLRDGEVVFDLAATLVTEPLLKDLYARNLDELSGGAPRQPDPLLVSELPVAVVNCR